MEDSDLVFDRVLHSVGEDGRFQRRYNIFFNYFLALCSTLIYMNYVLAFAVPGHWCHVPGNENNTNYTAEEWKRMNIPREYDSRGLETYSSCRMYNQTLTNISDNAIMETTECRYGYEYDKTWYASTVVSKKNWVCDKELYIPNTFAAIKFMEVVGGTIMGYLGDIVGRRPVHVASLTMMTIGRLIMPYLSEWYIPFTVAALMVAIPSQTIIQSCMVIIMEISSPEKRSLVGLVENLGWSTALCILPGIYWICKDWTLYLLISSAPVIIYFFAMIFLIESPRWLLSRGRVPECLKQLKIIAKANGTRLSPDSALLLQNCALVPEKTYGLFSLFSSWRLSRTTLMFLCVRMCCVVNYYTLLINLSNMKGNPYLNFFLQALADFPSYLIGRQLCDSIGRRYSGIFGFCISIIGYIVLILTMNDPDQTWLHISMVVLAKFAVSIAYFATLIQGLEIYPMCIRQSANSLGNNVGHLACIFMPYVTYLGSVKYATLPFLVLLALCILAVLGEVLLPETLHERLPETLYEAQTFGKDQASWRFPHKKNDDYILAHLKVIRRQHSENYDKENADSST